MASVLMNISGACSSPGRYSYSGAVHGSTAGDGRGGRAGSVSGRVLRGVCLRGERGRRGLAFSSGALPSQEGPAQRSPDELDCVALSAWDRAHAAAPGSGLGEGRVAPPLVFAYKLSVCTFISLSRPMVSVIRREQVLGKRGFGESGSWGERNFGGVGFG